LIIKKEKFANAVCAVSHGLTTADQYPYDHEKLQKLADEMRVARDKDEKKKMEEFESNKKKP